MRSVRAVRVDLVVDEAVESVEVPELMVLEPLVPPAVLPAVVPEGVVSAAVLPLVELLPLGLGVVAEGLVVAPPGVPVLPIGVFCVLRWPAPTAG